MSIGSGLFHVLLTAFALNFAVLTPSTGTAKSASEALEETTVPDPVALFRRFAGKSQDWGGGSYIYWAPDGTFQAVNETEQSVGKGRWYVTTASGMCYEGTWVWRQDFGINERRVKNCSWFRVDSAGTMWASEERRGASWFPHSAETLTPSDWVAQRYEAMLIYLNIAEIPNSE